MLWEAAMRATGVRGGLAMICTGVGERDIPLPHGSLRCALLRSKNIPFADSVT